VVEYESDEDEDLEPIMLQADDIEEHDYSLDGSKVGQLRKAQMASDGDAEDLKVLKTQGLKRKAFPAGAKEGKGSVKRVKTTSVPKRSGAKTAQTKGLTINISSNIRANGAHAVVRNMHYSEGNILVLTIFLAHSLCQHASISALLNSGSDTSMVILVDREAILTSC
jgi:hypothetical protein